MKNQFSGDLKMSNKRIHGISTCLGLTLALFAGVWWIDRGHAQSYEPDWYLQPITSELTNAVTTGQYIGCALRFVDYAEIALEQNPELNTTLSSVYLESFGNLDLTIDEAFAYGSSRGWVGDQEAFKELVNGMATMEVAQGVHWLQVLGCYNILLDHSAAVDI